MQAKTLPKGKSAAAPKTVANSQSNETRSSRNGAAKTLSGGLSKQKIVKAAGNGSSTTSKPKSQISKKRVKFSFLMPQAELDDIVTAKHKLSEVVGAKVKKSNIVRAGVLLLLSLSESKIRAALGKISAIDSSSVEQKTMGVQ
jgi:hypothetical protein